MFYKLVVFLAGMATMLSGGAAIAAEKGKAMADKNAFEFSFQDIGGADLPLSQFEGKALLVVNTASRCGFTKQYAGLQFLYEKYKDKGFVLLGVPSNDFMGQEPGSNAEIKKFCETSFGINFPLTEKVHVKGAEAHPFYLWAAAQKDSSVPAWNFTKYLIAPDGTLIKSFGSRTEPDDEELIAAIEKALP